MNNFLHQLQGLSWHRLRAELVNVRASERMTEHPFSVMQAIVKRVSLKVRPENTELRNPPVIFHITGRPHTFKIREGARVPLEVLLFQCTDAEAERWRQAFIGYFEEPEPWKNFVLAPDCVMERRSFADLKTQLPATPPDEVCLDFLSPLPFKVSRAKSQTHLSKDAFVQAFESRFGSLFGSGFAFGKAADGVSVLPYYWRFTKILHSSKSLPGTDQEIRGCFGRLYLKGDLGEILPLLLLGAEVHTGSKLSNSQGYYLLHLDPQPHFDRDFPNPKALVPVIRDVIHRYDMPMDDFCNDARLPDEETLAADLCRDLSTCAYIPAPATAFVIVKKDKTNRLVEQLSYRDLTAQQYVLKTVSSAFEKIFEPESIGFRKGMSRAGAVELVQAAVADGYEYVIESDIDDFFPSVHLDVLATLLDFYLPQADTKIRSALLTMIRAGYVLGGMLHERIKGLAQGSPLSPLLANLYLDSFDEHVAQWNARLIRYADDFIILTRTREEADAVLSCAEAEVGKLGLHLNKDKTSTRRIKDGFNFLGIRFEQSDAAVLPEEEPHLLKKPLFITEPYLFLGLNGEAVDIRRQRLLLETIPLRRISEIMVMDKATVSTSLLEKCATLNIPVSLTLNSGYYIATIKPDSKKYFDTAYDHARAYYAMSDTERLCIAREFAAGKINNYIALFRQRYRKSMNDFLGEMERTVDRMYLAADTQQLRGYEGAAAKKIYQELNAFIDNDLFKIQGRSRKKPDRINSLLNFGYYLLFSRINATVRAIGLNPYLGFLHSPEDNYESFVCDIEELFRARIDRFIIRLINLKIITEKDFTETERGCYLTHVAAKTFLGRLEEEMFRKPGERGLSLKDSMYRQIIIFKKYYTENTQLSFYRWEDKDAKSR